MKDAENAFELARKEIQRASRDNSEAVELYADQFKALQSLPEEIAELSSLKRLNLAGTAIRDLEPLRHSKGLTWLVISRTEVSNLEPIGSLENLQQLHISNTNIRDLSSLKSLRNLYWLDISDNLIADLEPIWRLNGVWSLNLARTRVENLSPIRGWRLKNLDITETPIKFRELRAISEMKSLVPPWSPSPPNAIYEGIKLQGCAATYEDPEIAAIAAVTSKVERAERLLTYLQRSSSSVDIDMEVRKLPVIPARQPAPMEIFVSEEIIDLSGPSELPVVDDNIWAEQGWAALKRQREDFEKAFSIHNCRPLPEILASFDREMGTAYDPARSIGIGFQGERLKAQAHNRVLCEQLPDGAEADLRALVAAIGLFVGRFPDWRAYRERGGADDFSAESLEAAADDFRDLQGIISTTPEASTAVKAEYAGLVAEGTASDAGEIEARGLVASTAEVARALGARGLEDVERHKRNRRAARLGGDFIDKTLIAPTTGLALRVMERAERPARSLARRFPEQMGWLEYWYDYMFGPDGDRKG